jgi:hypothetical protein
LVSLVFFELSTNAVDNFGDKSLLTALTPGWERLSINCPNQKQKNYSIKSNTYIFSLRAKNILYKNFRNGCGAPAMCISPAGGDAARTFVKHSPTALRRKFPACTFGGRPT